MKEFRIHKCTDCPCFHDKFCSLYKQKIGDTVHKPSFCGITHIKFTEDFGPYSYINQKGPDDYGA